MEKLNLLKLLQESEGTERGEGGNEGEWLRG
jgi:hypothetical protein